MFTIDYVKFYEGCKCLKNLKCNIEYSLKHEIDANFYAPNICITAIVGKNGAGKSSLIDMIFRIINNLSYCLFNNLEKEDFASFCYIKGIYADLKYISNKKEMFIYVRDGLLVLNLGEIKCKFLVYGDDNHYDFKNYEFCEKLDFIKQKNIAKLLFFTIATNYSIQSFISQDYSHEDLYIKENGNIEQKTNNISWLDNLFHKNDGYLTPLVLNPYRSNGMIDMNNEEHLTRARLLALLIEERECSLIDGYNLEKISFYWEPRKLQEKFTSLEDGRTKLYPNKDEIEEYNRYELIRLEYKENQDLQDFKTIALRKDSYAHVILGALRCSVREDMNNMQLYIRMYVVYKILSIAGKYPSYYYYKQYFGNINYTFAVLPKESRELIITKLKDFIKQIKNESSHIGLKLKQALNFLSKEHRIDYNRIKPGITYEDYAKMLGIESKGMAIKKRMEWLPPSIFYSNVELRQIKEDKILQLEHLSSGERQFLYLVSTLLYHAMNLSTIPKNGTRIRYNKLNFILDEVEICFHPEYQRQFVKKIKDLFQRLKLNKEFDINILFTTHSPFILSDIPTSNILCLEAGTPTDSIENQTFCSNIYDLMNNHFFMTQFVGDIASEKLDFWVTELNDLDKSRNPVLDIRKLNELKNNVQLIGDRYIKGKLLEKINKIKYEDTLEAEYNNLKERLIEIEALRKNKKL